MFVVLTEGIDPARHRVVILQSIATATVVAQLSVWFGQVLLASLGVTRKDFMSAGGILLLATIAVMLIRRELSGLVALPLAGGGADPERPKLCIAKPGEMC